MNNSLVLNLNEICKVYLCHINFSVVHEIEDILELSLVNALQVEERILLVSVVRKDATEERRTRCLLTKILWVSFVYVFVNLVQGFSNFFFHYTK